MSRTSLAIRNILASFVFKGWSGIVQLLLVPLTIACLGTYVNGLWMTIAAILMWIDNMDIGLANGLRNKLAEAKASGDDALAKSYVSTTFAMLCVIMALVIVCMLLFNICTDMSVLLNIDSSKAPDTDTVLILAFVVTSVTFVFKITSNVYLALQLPAVSNLIMVAGQTCTLLAVTVLYLCHSTSLISISLAYTLSPLLVNIIAFAYTFTRRYPELRPSLKSYSSQHLASLFSLGIRFFVIQIASIILFMSGNIIISRLFTPEAVTPYQVAYRYYSLALIVFTLIVTPFWSATTDAYNRHDYEWIMNARSRFRLVMLCMAAMLFIMVSVSDWVFLHWVGSEVVVSRELSIYFALYLFVIMYSQTYSFFLNGMGVLNLQLVMTVLAAIAYIPLAVIMARSLGVPGICLALSIVNIPGAIVNMLQFDFCIKTKMIY